MPSVNSQGTSQVLPDFSSSARSSSNSDTSYDDDQSFDQVLSSQRSKHDGEPHAAQSAKSSKDTSKTESEPLTSSSDSSSDKMKTTAEDEVEQVIEEVEQELTVNTSQIFDEDLQEFNSEVSNVDELSTEAETTESINVDISNQVIANDEIKNPDTQEQVEKQDLEDAKTLESKTVSNPLNEIIGDTEASEADESLVEAEKSVEETDTANDVIILAAQQEAQPVHDQQNVNLPDGNTDAVENTNLALAGKSSATTETREQIVLEASQTEDMANSDELQGEHDFATELKDQVTTQAQSSKESSSDFKSTLETAKPVQMSIARPVTSEGWGDKVFERIQWMANAEQQKAEIRLDPPDLGPLKIEVTIKNDAAQVTMTSHSSTVRDILDQNMSRLRDALESQGFQSVDAQTRDGQQESSGQQARDQRIASLKQGTDEDMQHGTIIVENSSKGRVDCYI